MLIPKTAAPVVCLLLSVVLAPRLSLSDTGAPAEPIALSKVIEQLSQDPTFRERFLQSLDRLPNAWGLIGPNQRTRLRNFILDRNWSGIDHFPALTVAQLRASVSVANTAADKYPGITKQLQPPYVEVGRFSTESGGDVDWEIPAGTSQTAPADPLTDIGFGLTMGDPPDPELWKWHSQSVRASQLFNRLALNRLLDDQHVLRVRLNGQPADSPQALLSLLDRSGYEVRIEDSRYFANFGHLHFHNQDVLMPFWLNTRIPLPGTRQSLLAPVSHAEDEIRIRGADGHNADVSFYFGIDGMTEFRTMDTLDQYWVGKNVAHTYRHAQAVEVARLLGEVLDRYAVLQKEHPNLPFNGYYRFGVCQDAVAAIEYHMEGKVSLFPITHDPAYFKGNSEIDKLYSKLPEDRSSRRVSWARVRGSLPAKSLADIRIPGLRHNLELVARAQGEKREVRGWLWGLTAIAVLAGLVAALRFGLGPRRA